MSGTPFTRVGVAIDSPARRRIHPRVDSRQTDPPRRRFRRPRPGP